MIYLSVPVIFAAALLLAVYAAWHAACHSPNKTQGDIYSLPSRQHREKAGEITALIRELDMRPYEKVFICSHDGLRLMGRYYCQREGAPLALCMHGYRGTAIRDFCGGSRIAFELGHNLLIVDQRAHGESGGHTIAFGVEERLDCLDWLKYAVGRFGCDTPMALYGVSMGAATVLMASGLGLPENVKCIVADCPYSSPRAIISKVCRDMRLPPGPAYWLVRMGAKLFGRVDLDGASAVDAVRQAGVPVMLIHGEADDFVPCSMSREIHGANPHKISLHTFPGAGHGLSYIEDRPRYEALVREFLRGQGL